MKNRIYRSFFLHLTLRVINRDSWIPNLWPRLTLSDMQDPIQSSKKLCQQLEESTNRLRHLLDNCVDKSRRKPSHEWNEQDPMFHSSQNNIRNIKNSNLWCKLCGKSNGFWKVILSTAAAYFWVDILLASNSTIVLQQFPVCSKLESWRMMHPNQSFHQGFIVWIFFRLWPKLKQIWTTCTHVSLFQLMIILVLIYTELYVMGLYLLVHWSPFFTGVSLTSSSLLGPSQICLCYQIVLGPSTFIGPACVSWAKPGNASKQFDWQQTAFIDWPMFYVSGWANAVYSVNQRGNLLQTI